MIMPRLVSLVPATLLVFGLAACTTGEGSTEQTPAFSGIASEETVHFLGNEPFWGGNSAGSSLTYTTPENIDGTTFPVTRFAGNSGIGLSGTMEGASFDMTVTEGECSDTMSDRTYPFTVTLKIDDEQRQGCAWTDRQPFTGPENP